MLRELNCPKRVVLWYRCGGEVLSVGLKEFKDDKGALEMVGIAAG